MSDWSISSGPLPEAEPRVRVAQRVGPEQVGQRVVLRRRLADGGVGDLLGDLVRWDSAGSPDPRATVRTRAGEVTVALGDVLGGKPVPPAPARRGRPHRTIDWRDLEDVAGDGWRPTESDRLAATAGQHGWLLRAADGFTGRANSVLAVGDPGLPLVEAVDRVEAWYAARGLPPRFAVPWPLSVRRLTAGRTPTRTRSASTPTSTASSPAVATGSTPPPSC